MNTPTPPPNILYKYREFQSTQSDSSNNDFLKSLLTEGELYFSTSLELNDQFERFFAWSGKDFHILTEKEINQANLNPLSSTQQSNRSYLVKLTPADCVKYFLFHMKKQEAYGIYCLSKHRDSIPMYSLYADGFKGLCIGFDWKQFDLKFAGSSPPVQNMPRKVSYETEPLKIKGRPDEWLRVFTTKSSHFAWEQEEWRIFYKKGTLRKEDINIKTNVRNSIREIIFGHEISEENKNKTKEWVKDLRHIKFFITKPVIGKYELQIIPHN